MSLKLTKTTLSLSIGVALCSLYMPIANAATFVMEKNNQNYAIDGNNGAKEGQQLYMWKTDASNVNQQWVQLDQGDGYYSYKKNGTSLCWDGGDGGAKGQAVTLEDCDSSDKNQHWKKVKVTSGTEIYRFEKRNSSGYSIDGGNKGKNGQVMYLWSSNSGNVNQQWELTNLNDVDTDTDTDNGSTDTGSSDFDWDGWKVTMPVNGETYYNDGNTDSAAELLPSNCSDETFDSKLSNDYFWSDSEGLHFKVAMNLDGKTPNTSYIRSELRELYKWSPCDSTSTANWSYGGNHTLEATLRIDDYNDDSPKVVVGQVHGHDIDYATIKLHWEGDDKPIRVIYNEKPSKSSSEDIDLGYVDSSGFWSYKIKMTSSGIELTAGGVTKTLKFGEELSNDWKDEDFYFKAGLYPQEKPSSSSKDVYEATFSEVVATH